MGFGEEEGIREYKESSVDCDGVNHNSSSTADIDNIHLPKTDTYYMSQWKKIQAGHLTNLSR